MADPAPVARATLVRLPIATAAEILARAGAACTEASIRADVAAGAPVNPDGTINLLAYGAWLVREHGQAGVGGA